MLSNNLKIIRNNNCSFKKNLFKLVNKYTIHYENNSKYHIAYITYLKDKNGKDKLIYSHRTDRAAITTWYDLETTRICEIKDNKIIDDKELIRHNNMSHNLTLFNNDNNIIGYGGVCTSSHTSKNNKGIFYFTFDNYQISNIKLVIPKTISIATNYATAFDSNICVLTYNNKVYAYTRYNQQQGIRRTQLFISDKFDSGFKSKGIVVFNDPTVFTYMQNIYIENDIFIGIFRIYRKKYLNSHTVYDCNTKISYLLAHSFDGINFIIDNENFIPSFSIYDLLSTNYKKNQNKKSFFFSNISPPNMQKNNTIKEYEIRDGGYIYIEPAINSNESEIDLQVLNNKNTILLNYTIDNEGYIHIAFLDEHQKTISKKQLLIKDHTNNRLDLPTNCKFINIKFKKSKIYQIL